MDDDIVERLRSIPFGDDEAAWAAVAKAADEIERLRKEVDLKGYRLDDALDEIERLREERNDWQKACHKAWEELGHLTDEVERLRTAGDALLAALRAETVNGAMAVCDGTNEAMEAWEARRG